jgi:tetratricopeptide (TPR) repeat protein
MRGDKRSLSPRRSWLALHHRLTRPVRLALVSVGLAGAFGLLGTVVLHHRASPAEEWAARPLEELEALARRDPRNAGAQLGLGLHYARAGDTARATAALERCIALDPHRAEAYATLGEMARQKGDDRRTAELFSTAVHLDPGFNEGYLHAANALVHMQSYRQARPMAVVYARRQHGDWRGPFLLGMIRAGEGKMPEALTHYTEAIRRAPDRGPTYLNAGATYLFGPATPERLAAAGGWFERGLAVAPRYPELHYYLGLVRFRQRRWSEASAVLQEAVSLKPSLTEAYYPLAQSLLKLGRTTDAKLCLDLYTRHRAAERRSSEKVPRVNRQGG